MAVNHFGLRTKFTLCYLFVMATVLALTGGIYYATTWSRVYNTATESLLTLVQKNNQIIDQQLNLISEYANGLTVDSDVLGLLDAYQNADSLYDYYALDRGFTGILSKYFLYCDDILSTNIMTGNLSYGQSGEINVIPVDTFHESRVYQAAVKARGQTVWIPTYHFFEEYRQNYIQLDNNIYQYVFTAAKLIRQLENDDVILVINFLESMLSEPFSSHNAEYEADFFILSPDGTVVTHSRQDRIATTVDEPWLKEVIQQGAGVITAAMDGREVILSFSPSEVTGWISCISTTKQSLMHGFLKDILHNMLLILAVLAATCTFAVALLSGGILKPILALQRGMSQSGHGNFDAPVNEAGIDEMRTLIRHFNRMNGRLRQLIYENYQMVILRKEQELNAYNLQVNPHFILNSLNLLSLELIQAGEDELSDFTSELSSIMDYTLNTHDIMVPFSLDWKYTLAYLNVMRKRYAGRFTFMADIDPTLLDVSVPKFLLQPLIENSLSHGCVSMARPIKITINARKSADEMIFDITDDGIGFAQEKVAKILSTKPLGGAGHSGGINNARFRIQSIYGESRDVEIQSIPLSHTQITIRLPLCPPFSNDNTIISPPQVTSAGANAESTPHFGNRQPEIKQN